jgi:tape measure domain-containing protein
MAQSKEYRELTMATVRELITKIGFEVDERGLKDGQARLQKFKKFAKRAMLGVGAAVVGIGVAAVKSAADIEMLETQFEVMLGSATKARDMMEDLNKFSLVTPFEPKQLAKATQVLLNFGVASNDIMKTLQMLGDVSGGNTEKFASLALVFGQIQSTGRLMGQDLLQLINAGFNPLQVISKKTGKSVAVLKEEMSKGKISADDVTEAFKLATSEGGMFFQSMQKGSKTLKGVFSTVKGAIDLALAAIGKEMLPILKEFSQEVIKIADETVKWVKLNRDQLTKTFRQLAKFLRVVLKLVLAVGKAFKFLFIDTPIGATILGIVAAYKALAVAIGIATVAQALFNKTSAAGVAGGLGKGLGNLGKGIGGAALLKKLGIAGLVIGGTAGVSKLVSDFVDKKVLEVAPGLKFTPESFERKDSMGGFGQPSIVTQKNTFQINAPAGKNGETGLTPSALKKAMKGIAEGTLNKQMRQILVTSN